MKKLIVTAPGKIIISGQHSVVYEKNALCGAIDLKCRCECWQQESDQSKITFILSDLEQTIQVLLQEVKQQLVTINHGSYSQYMQHHELNITKQIERNKLFQYKVLKCLQVLKQKGGFTDQIEQFFKNKKNSFLKIKSQIPFGGGLGSSAAFSTCIAASLLSLIKSINQNYNPVQIDRPLVNLIAYEYEKIYHSKPSGLDNYISLNGGLLVFNKVKDPYPIEWNMGLKIGVINSKVQKNTKKAVTHVAEQYPTTGKAIIDQIGELTNQLIEFVQKGEQMEFLKIIKKNHRLLNSLGLSNKQIEQIVERHSGQSSASKITGAGMGGYVLVLAKTCAEIEGVEWKTIDREGLKIEIAQNYNIV